MKEVFPMQCKKQFRNYVLGPLMTFLFVFGPPGLSWGAQLDNPSLRSGSLSQLARAKMYLQAGDYRRAVEACMDHIDTDPSVEAYVYLAYVYEALDGYLAYLVKKEDYVRVEQLSLNLTARAVIDLIDPPNVLPRMAQELIHEGIRQQFDITAGMANRLDRSRTDQLWLEQTAWRQERPDSWWHGIPPQWRWE